MYRLLRNASIIAVALAAACSSGDGGNGLTEPTGSISITLGASTITLAQGEDGTVEVSVVRSESFAGTVALSVEGAPTGVTANVSPSQTSGASATLTVTVGESVAPGSHLLTVRGRVEGLSDRTATVALTIVAGRLQIATPANQTIVIGQPFTLQLDAAGPGTHAFATVGQPLPDGLSLNAATGVISGAPTGSALLGGTPAGQWDGIVVEVTNGTTSGRSASFSFTITGTQLPAPYAYVPFDGTSLDDVFGRTGAAIGNVTAGVPGVIGNGATVSGTDSRIRYATSLASQLNDKAAFTIATTLRTTSAGTMFFGLADQSLGWNRVYAELLNGRIYFGGRSQRRQTESFQGTVGSVQVNDGQFHTFVGVIELPSDRLSVYVDGVLDRSDTVAFNQDTFETMAPANENLIGHLTSNADTSVAPTVTHDEFALWDVALNADQVATVRWLILSGTTLRQWIGF